MTTTTTASDWYQIAAISSPLETRKVPMSPHRWTNFATGWISRGKRVQTLSRANCLITPPPPTISSPSPRSLHMTGGLFNTGVTGDFAEFTGDALTIQPAVSTSKVTGHDFVSAETSFDTDLDMNMFEDLGVEFDDPLGDASLDSFMDINALLSENNILDVTKDGFEVEPVIFTTLDPADIQLTEVKAAKKSLKRPFTAVEEVNSGSDLGKLVAEVGVLKAETLDHDYTPKRPRMSVSAKQSATTSENVFFANPPASPSPYTFSLPSPAPSTSSSYCGGEDKSRSRREKNNVASKRSRETRKKKFVDMEQEAEILVVENARLEQRVIDLERLAKQMKEILVAKMAGK